MICCSCIISGRLSNFLSHGVKNRFLIQEIVIKMRKCAIYVRTQILCLHNVKLKTSLKIQCKRQLDYPANATLVVLQVVILYVCVRNYLFGFEKGSIVSLFV